jgi:hypothetical protein
MTSRLDALVVALRETRDPVPAGELATRLGVSQPTLSRAVAEAGERVVRIGRARATRYALSREIPRAGSRWPLYRLDAQARPHRVGELRALRGEGFHLAPASRMPALRGEFAQGLFPGMPWFLDDQRPQGFLGRAFARRHADELGAPDDVLRWNHDHVVHALLRHGENLAGDLLLGDAALARALAFVQAPEDAIDAAQRETRYAILADAAMRGELPGSSAAGERPKFLATLREGATWRSVIVKFSERAGSPAAQRWADLLHCECLASETLRTHGIAAAQETIVEAGGRTFLQSTRFHRTPALGRRGFVSLAALDAAHYGRGPTEWWRFAEPLQRDGWIGAEDAVRLRRMSLFGRLIANTDMHLGNVAFEFADAPPFALCPTYDMLPMRFAPAGTGEIVPRAYELSPPLPEILDDRHAAAAAAADFWQRVLAAHHIGVDFRAIAESAMATLSIARERYA